MFAVAAPPEGPAREALYERWFEWVSLNLGRDPRLASMAASAAADAAVGGSGFNAAADAARAAWSTHAGEQVAPRSVVVSGAPWPLKGAAGIGIGGAALSALISLWFAAAPSICGTYGCGSIALAFAFYNAAWAALNWALFRAILRGSRRTWKVTLILVALGALADIVGQLTYVLFIVDLGAIALLAEIGFAFGVASEDWFTNLAANLGGYWLIVHLIVVQLPMLLLLLAGRPGRPQVESPRGAELET